MQENLIRVSTYASQQVNKRTGTPVSVMTVYRWIREGKIKGKVIDGVHYVVVESKD